MASTVDLIVRMLLRLSWDTTLGSLGFDLIGFVQRIASLSVVVSRSEAMNLAASQLANSVAGDANSLDIY